MNKTAIKNYAIWARNKLIADISYKAGLLGITEKGIKSPLPQSTQTVQFFDIGTREPSSITGIAIEQRKKLVDEINQKAKQSDYVTAFNCVIEEVAYTWFNRLIAIRFMEVNDYLPTRIRVLSSASDGKVEPDLVTHALEASLVFSAYEKDRIIQLKYENELDELFRMLFIKQCNALNANLPYLFEKTNDYTELLLNVSFTDKEGVVYHLINGIAEDDFNVSKEGQVEIIGWLYQYYNTEPKDETFALLKKNIKITKERIPAATQLFTPDWIVRYMVENSLGRLWLEGHPNDELKSNWKYYLDEAEQEEDVQIQLKEIREAYKAIKPEDIKIIDPAMGSGHILVYAFDVLIQIYESYGYSQRDAARSIVENNLYGLEIDNRAYQLAYFAVMMKARQCNRRILDVETTCHIYSIQESNDINRNHLKCFGSVLSTMERNTALLQISGLLDTFTDAMEFGSILKVEKYNWELLHNFIEDIDADGQMSMDTIGLEQTKAQMKLLIEIGEAMTRNYDVVATNPPYMGSSGMSGKLAEYIKENYPESKADLFAVFIERCTQMVKLKMYQAMITQHSFMFLSSFEKLRRKLLLTNDFVNMAHLGPRAFDEIGGEVVQTASFIIRKSNLNEYLGTFLRLINPTSQQKKEELFLSGLNRYTSKKKYFGQIPGCQIAYWLTNNWLDLFTGLHIKDYGVAKEGIKTGNNDLFLKNWYEVNIDNTNIKRMSTNTKWYMTAKAGEHRRWYGAHYVLTNFANNGSDIIACGHGSITGKEYFNKTAITWNRIATNKLAFRYLPAGFISNMGGLCFYPHNNDQMGVILAFFNSIVAEKELNVINPTMNFPPGTINAVGIKVPQGELFEKISNLSWENVSIARDNWDSTELSWDFNHHPLRQGVSKISDAYKQWETECLNRFNKLKVNEETLNSYFINMCHLEYELKPEISDKEVTIEKADQSRDIRSFISYAVGCMFGRYSLDQDGLVYAGGEWDNTKYSILSPVKDNIIPFNDNEYFQDDLAGRLVEFVKAVYGTETLESNLNFIAKALGSNGNSSREVIRNYLLKGFFKDHCQFYKKRPIYWLFDSGKQNGFKALAYMHRFDENTIGNLRIDYLHRMQRIYENEIARMQDAIENSRDAREVTAATKRKEKLIKQLRETKGYDEKIAHLALARISIDLDDGVKVNYEKIQTDRDGKKLEVLAKI